MSFLSSTNPISGLPKLFQTFRLIRVTVHAQMALFLHFAIYCILHGLLMTWLLSKQCASKTITDLQADQGYPLPVHAQRALFSHFAIYYFMHGGFSFFFLGTLIYRIDDPKIV